MCKYQVSGTIWDEVQGKDPSAAIESGWLWQLEVLPKFLNSFEEDPKLDKDILAAAVRRSSGNKVICYERVRMTGN